MTKEIESDVKDKEPVKVYEVGYLVTASVPEEKIGEESSAVRSVVEKHGAYIISEEMPRFRQLAYIIETAFAGKREKHPGAYFGHIKFEVAGSAVAEIKKDLTANRNLIRFILLGVPREIPVAHKTMFRTRSEKPKAESGEAKPAKITMTEAELDKTIEELVVE